MSVLVFIFDSQTKIARSFAPANLLICTVFVVTDCRGLTATCTQVVTVVDTTPPTIMCPSNRVVECGSTWEFGTPTVVSGRTAD